MANAEFVMELEVKDPSSEPIAVVVAPEIELPKNS